MKSIRQNFRVVSGTIQRPAAFTVRATQRQALCAALAGRDIFFLAGGRNISEDSTNSALSMG